MTIQTRRAGIGDSTRIGELLTDIAALHHNGRPDMFKAGSRKYSGDEFAALLKDENRPVFVAADENGRVVGYCFCMIVRYAAHAVFNDCFTLYIDDFCVDRECRGRGVGRILFEAVKAYAREIGVYNIDLNVWEFNQSAIRFYESVGMTTQRRRMELILTADPGNKKSDP